MALRESWTPGTRTETSCESLRPPPFCVAPKRLKPFGSYAELSPSCVARGARLRHQRNVVQPRAKQGLSHYPRPNLRAHLPSSRRASVSVYFAGWNKSLRSLRRSRAVPKIRSRSPSCVAPKVRSRAQHNAGKTRSTRSHRPWEIVVAIYFADPGKAQAFERYLKHGSGHAFANRHFW